jgi:hypothetical protein
LTTPVAPVAPEPGTTAEYVHQLIILDGNTQVEYPWTVQSPFALALDDEQAAALMQTIADALPPNPYGWRVNGS